MSQIKRVLVSVTDKTGIVDFCKTLSGFGAEIISTGGTAKVIREAGITVKDISDFTGFPEILDGRLKTLHPKVEGGILGDRDLPSHVDQMKKHDLEAIDMIVVNLYEFEKTISQENCSLAHAIENIDIGGPTMLRAGAKNYKHVSVVTDPGDYKVITEEMKNNKGVVSVETNFRLAQKVFKLTAYYDSVIAGYLDADLFPQKLSVPLTKITDLRYGENPHQKAALYAECKGKAHLAPTLVDAVQKQGKELSFNNYLDLEAAFQIVKEFSDPACVIIKHTNPCGVALGKNIFEAYTRALECDPVSSFGGIVGLNREVDEATAVKMSEIFFECIVAPSFSSAALEVFGKKKNLRLLEVPFSVSKNPLDFKKISGGFLIQDADSKSDEISLSQTVTTRKPGDDELSELAFAWKIVKHVKSNAIVITQNRQIVGVGAGQMSRVDSVNIACSRLQDRTIARSHDRTGPLVLASDAFFPFRDGLDLAAKHGVKAVIQPGGSVKDPEVIEAANQHQIAMVFTGKRHFKH